MSPRAVTRFVCALALLLATSRFPGARSSLLPMPNTEAERRLARFFAPRLEEPRLNSRDIFGGAARAFFTVPGDTAEHGRNTLPEPEVEASKRSALRAALHSGRRRRDPPPAHGKAVTPYISVGVLSDMSLFFDTLRENLHVLASMSPDERAAYLSDSPVDLTPVEHSTTGGPLGAWAGGASDWAAPSPGGEALRPSGTAALLHALRPLHRSYRFSSNAIAANPSCNSHNNKVNRSYDRRSLLEQEPPEYSNANSHDPGLLWTGLGRR